MLVSLKRRVSVTAFALGLGLGLSAQGEPPPDYYDPVDTTSAATLRATVHEVIDDHTRFPYTSTARDTWDILEDADEDPNDSARILDLYKNSSYAKEGGGNSNYNREHSWPKSYGFPKDVVANYPFTDAHHLFLADSGYNSSRSNIPYRTCNSDCAEKVTDVNNGQGGGSGVFPGNSNWRTGEHETGTWQTWRGRKGDVARALFYLDVRYEGGTHGVTDHAEPDLILTDNAALIQADSNSNKMTAYMGDLSVLLLWHAEDPADELERKRNDSVFSDQGNRNPFIDHPEWAACVFQDDCPNAPPPGTEDCRNGTFSVSEDGTVCADRAYFSDSGGFNAGQGADLAEHIDASEPLEPGNLVELDPQAPGLYRKARGPNTGLAVGVITSVPAITLGNQPADPTSSGSPLLALMGRVPVRATAENGPIRVGDLLVSSSTLGAVMRCAEPDGCRGTLVGKALEALEHGDGMIEMLLMR